jgi:hypothetical protein
MFWALLKPTEECPVHEMWPVTIDGDFMPEHVSGIDCVCRPCLDDRVGEAQLAEGGSILYHHVLLDGKPLKSDLWDSHGCKLK